MNTLVIVLIAAVCLLCGYMVYGRWLAKTWGIDPKAKTPAYTHEDGQDYVPTNGWIVFSHQFSSIAGAGPVTGAIQAAAFGWVPVLLWILVGGVFFGAVTDFGALYASVKNEGKSMGLLIEKYIGKTGKRLFLIFCWLFTLIVIAAFADMVAGTFNAYTVKDGVTELAAAAQTNGAAGSISIAFIVFAMVFGVLQKKLNLEGKSEFFVGLACTVASLAIGMAFPLIGGKDAWTGFTFAYIFFASVLPMWLLKQPRDYMTTFMFAGMILGAVVGIVVAHPNMNLPMYTGFTNEKLGNMFPILFVTVACGAISGFHSLVSSGTTSKQLDKETDAKPIAYGGMLLECVLAVLTLCAIGYAYKWNAVHPDQALKGATAIFGGGIAHMIDDIIPGSYSILNSLLVLTYSAFCLTSLDTATRLARFMFQEFWLEPGETAADIKEGWKKVMVNPYFATILTVVLGILLGMNGYGKIWGLFGAANQLLAGIGLLAVATWLGNMGKNNKMFLIPMAFMIVVTITSLALTVKNQIGMIAAGGADWGPWAQTILGILLIFLAIILVIEGVQTLSRQKAAKA